MITKDDIQNNTLKEILKYDKCGVNISMGVGKTRIAIKHLDNFNYLKALIVIPKLSIKKTWIEEIEKLNFQHLYNNIEFTTYLSLTKKDYNNYQLLYLDECHNLLESHESFLKNYKGKILGLTGTAPVDIFSIKYNLIEKYCPIIFNFSVDEATENNILNDYKIYIHYLELNKQKNILKKTNSGKQWYTSEFEDYLYSCNRLEKAESFKEKQMASIFRMKNIMNYESKEKFTMDMISNIKSKCIVFANTQDQADRLSNYSYHSNNQNSEKNLELFSNDKINILSCVAQLNEGITIPNLKMGIIMHAYGNERKTSQRIGRLLRLNPDETAICHILCYKNTIDEEWVRKALQQFDSNKITYYGQ